MFDKRTGPNGIMYVGTCRPGTPIKNSVEDGDSAELRMGEERILIRNLRKNPDSSYSGRIQGFSPSSSIAFQNLKIGQEVTFTHEEIFACIEFA